ncbi:hypothetical protein [Pseudonocardia kunmingensis]|uniref:Uncharacterized protein n=1 Tax=Pseudonocardia kunmingensis TaxID=630975 RepID=A0A543DY34_9PSEU|nr:hypothetical protein [Pseudonocardia kunmingensis]TQM14224.1 hypothetical protein FB558_0984 [Pseudonocardia kunmingensis]
MPNRHLPAIAAGLYSAWGLLHLGLGTAMSWSALASGPPAGELEAESAMYFLCAIVFGVQAIVVALTLNRRNDRVGYWLNLAVLGAVDAAFLVVMVVPGHVDVAGGLSGPLLWCLAAAVSTAALRSGGVPAQQPEPATTPAPPHPPGSSAARASSGTGPAGW